MFKWVQINVAVPLLVAIDWNCDKLKRNDDKIYFLLSYATKILSTRHYRAYISVRLLFKKIKNIGNFSYIDIGNSCILKHLTNLSNISLFLFMSFGLSLNSSDVRLNDPNILNKYKCISDLMPSAIRHRSICVLYCFINFRKSVHLFCFLLPFSF